MSGYRFDSLDPKECEKTRSQESIVVIGNVSADKDFRGKATRF